MKLLRAVNVISRWGGDENLSTYLSASVSCHGKQLVWLILHSFIGFVQLQLSVNKLSNKSTCNEFNCYVREVTGFGDI